MAVRPIVLLTAGTRGDIQPLVALALAIRARGRAVRFVTHPPFRDLFVARGLEFAPLDGDLNSLLTTAEGRSALVYDGNLLRNIHASLTFLRTARARYAALLTSALQQCRDAEMLIVSLPTAVAGLQIAEALDVPCALALLQPVGRTGAFPTPLQPFAGSLGATYNRLSHGLLDLLIWLPWRAEVARWRMRELGLAPLPPGGPLAAAERHGMLALYGFSQRVVPPPADWPSWRRVTGYWFLDHPPTWYPPPELERFLSAGQPPVYLGFGSMGGPNTTGRIALFVTALRQLGLRGVLAFDAQLPADLAGSDMLAVQAIWHDWLFPRVAAAVHHGGAGTTAAALRAGIPSLCAPVGVDQRFWGERIAVLGCGPPPIPLRALTETQLVKALQVALDPQTRMRAAALGVQIRGEHGCMVAAEILTGG